MGDGRVQALKDWEFLGAVRRHLVLVLVIPLLAAVIGFGASSVMSPVYEGTASLLVGDFANGDVNNNELTAMQSLTTTYADIGRREPVLSAAARDVGLSTIWRELDGSVKIRVPTESPQVIEITVDGNDRERVVQLADAVATSLVRYVDGMSNDKDFITPQLRRLEQTIEQADAQIDALRARKRAEGGTNPTIDAEIERTQAEIADWQDNYASLKELSATSSQATIRPLDSADAPRTPISPNTRFNTIIAGFAGLLLALAIIYLLDPPGRLDDAVEGREAPPFVPPAPAQLTIPIHRRDDRRAGHSRLPPEQTEGEAR